MKKLKMQLLGNFSLTDGKVVLDQKVLHSKKLIRLLIYMLLYRDQVLTHQNLIEVFWENNSRNPESALKNQMHLIRSVLKNFGEERYICTLPGAYQWNPEIEVETDYEQLEKLLQLFEKAELTEQEQKELCEKIVFGYSENITDQLDGEEWIVSKKARYHSVYGEAVKVLGQILEKNKEWECLETLCNRILEMGLGDEDIWCWLMKALHGQKKHNQVVEQYELAKRQCYEEKGVSYSQKIQEIFQQIVNGTDISDIKTIKNLLEEPEEEKENSGAYFCDYQVFKQIYRIEARRIERLGIAEYAVLFSLERVRKRKKDAENDPLLLEGMNILESVIRSSLRSGDVGARYNDSQSVVLLPTCTYESAINVAERVAVNFQKQYKRKKMEIFYEIAEITVSA